MKLAGVLKIKPPANFVIDRDLDGFQADVLHRAEASSTPPNMMKATTRGPSLQAGSRGYDRGSRTALSFVLT